MLKSANKYHKSIIASFAAIALMLGMTFAVTLNKVRADGQAFRIEAEGMNLSKCKIENDVRGCGRKPGL